MQNLEMLTLAPNAKYYENEKWEVRRYTPDLVMEYPYIPLDQLDMIPPLTTNDILAIRLGSPSAPSNVRSIALDEDEEEQLDYIYRIAQTAEISSEQALWFRIGQWLNHLHKHSQVSIDHLDLECLQR